MVWSGLARRSAALKSFSLPLAVSGLALVLAAPALAQTWDGSANTNWDIGFNWSGNAVPADGGIVVIDGAGGANQPTLSSSSNQLSSATLSGGTLTVANGGNLRSTTVTVSGTGTLTIGAGGNVASFGVTVSGGTLNNNSTSGTNFGGGLTVSGGTVNNAGVVIGNTLVTSGTLNLNSGSNLGFAILTVNGGTVNVNTDQTVGTIAGTGGTIEIDSGKTLTFGGSLDKSFAGVVTGDGGLTKQGTGTFTLSGANSYKGLTTIKAGTLQVSNASGLGTTDAGTTVNSGATLALSGGITVAEAITLNGTGVGGNGALRNVSGDNTLTGKVTLGSAASITALLPTYITVNGAVDNGGFDLTVGGTGVVTFNNAISGDGGLVVDNTNGVNLSGTNTYTGTTTVNAGALSVANGSALSDTAALIVNAAGQVTFYDSETVGGLSGDGLIYLDGGIVTLTTNVLSGTETFSGSIFEGLTSNLTKTGAGTQVLSGSNAYTGLTTVAEGTLEITGSMSSSVVVDGTGRLRIGTSNAIGGSITTTGSTGATVSYVNGVTESSALILKATTTNLEVLGTDTATQSGAISGSGSLTKTGTGQLTVSGANIYTGLTTVAEGTLQVTNATGLGSTAAGTTVDSGATLALSGGITVAEAITLNGTGVGGNGALRNVSGFNTLTGKVTLGSAASISADGGSQLNVSGGIDNGGFDLTTGGVGQVIVSSAISGSGGLVKEGTGFVYLTGTNSYTGTTRVNDGSLNVSGGQALSDTAALIINSPGLVSLKDSETVGGLSGNGTITLYGTTLTTNVTSGTETFAGIVSQLFAPGSLIKTGAGTQVLSGIGGYEGTTTIDGGTLSITGNFALSAFTVNDGGTLGGTGTVGSTTVKAGGTLSPGASIGTLSVNGDLTLETDAIFLAELDADSTLSDLISVSGTATLAGTLRPVASGGSFQPFTTYRIIEANDVDGAFDTVDLDFLFLGADVDYGNTYVDLTLVRNSVALASVANTGNQASVADAIDGSIPDLDQGSPDYRTLVQQLVLVSDEAAFRDYLDQLSGAEYAQHLQSVLWSTRAIDRVVTERMECGTTGTAYAQADGSSVMPTADGPMAATGCFEPGELALWSRGFGAWNSLDGDANAPGYDETQYGILFGADYSFDGSWFLGVTGGYFDSNGDFDGFGGRPGSDIDYDGLQLAAYGGYDDSVFYARGILAYGNYDGSSDRLIEGPGGIAGRLSGDPSSDVLSFYGETGYRFGLGGSGHITPFAGLSLAEADLDGFTERDPDGTGAALHVDDADASSVASVLGVRFDAEMATGAGLFVPELSLAWSHEFGDTDQDVGMSFADGPPESDFRVTGSEVARDALLVDAGAKLLLSDSIDIGVSYSGWFSSDYTSNAITARLGVRF